MMTTVIKEGMEIGNKIGSNPIFRAVFLIISVGGVVHYMNKKLSCKVTKEELDKIVDRLDSEFQAMNKKHNEIIEKIQKLENSGNGASKEELAALRKELEEVKKQQQQHTESLEKRLNAETAMLKSIKEMEQKQKDTDKTFKEVNSNIQSLFTEIKVLTPANKKPIDMAQPVK